ncbi:MAG TPA: glycosyltransferase, partial [Thermoleophilaceae bacterium]
MRVAILAPGSLGNLVPYIALALGLREAGIEPVVATHPEFRESIEDRGLEFALIGGEGLFDQQRVKELQESGRNPITWARRAAALLEEQWDGIAADCMAASADADAMLFNAQGHAAYHIAQRQGIPAIGALYLPVSSTREFPHPLVAPGSRSMGRAGNALTYLVGEQMLWQVMRKPVQRWRRQALGLEPLGAGGIIRAIERERLPIVYGFSPAVVPRPSDWGDWLEVTGYWFLDPPDGWTPPADLERFLDAGSPPVYLGFGSSPIGDAGATYALLRDALRRVGARAIVAGDWAGGVPGAAEDEDVFLLPGFVPFDWLFARVAAVVHHGGCGTTHEGLRAGVPSVLLPSYPDQFFFGRRVVALNAGPQPIHKDKLTVDGLTAALRTALGDRAMQRDAAEVGARIREERGVRLAVERIESL